MSVLTTDEIRGIMGQAVKFEAAGLDLSPIFLEGPYEINYGDDTRAFHIAYG